MAGALSPILGPDGRPVARPGRQALGRGLRGARAWEAGDPASQDLGGWHPGTWSVDGALSIERQRIVDRLHDLVRNDGWAAGTVSSLVNSTIGPSFWFSANPDHEALGIDLDDAVLLAQQIEREWWLHGVDIRRYADAARHRTLPELFALLFRHVVIDGESLVLPIWRPVDGYPYRTAFQAVHPARLSNPQDQADSYRLRGGVELGEYGEALAYHIRAVHPGDLAFAGADYFAWERVPREWAWGRPRAIHYFLATELEQTRGVSPLAPIVRRLKMNQRYEAAELQAALANAILAAYIETSLAPELAAEALSDGTGQLDRLDARRLDWYERAPLSLNGFRIPVLPAGDKINFPTASRPNAQQDDFVAASLRNIAAATGLNPSTISRDYSQTNYSSERAALVESWRTITWSRETFAAGVATPMLACVVEEAIDAGRITLPPGAPGFWDAPAAYVSGEWIGPPRGWVDPLKEASAAKLRMDAGLSTLRKEAAEQGDDYQDILRQQARERREREALGLPPLQGGVSYSESDAEGNRVGVSTAA